MRWVAQVMEASRRRPSRPLTAGKPFEIVVGCSRSPGRPIGRTAWSAALWDDHHREDELGPVPRPTRSGRRLRLVLPRSVPTQHVDRDLGQSDRALATIAGLDRLQVPAAVQPLRLALDADLVAFPVDVPPA